VTKAQDLYALGVTLIHLLSGRVDVSREPSPDSLPDDLPAAVGTLVQDLLAPDPDARPDAAAAAACLSHQPA
jgi:hypothetical protein